MQKILFLIFINLIIITNACFTFHNTTEGVCINSVCNITNPRLEIKNSFCDLHSSSYIRLNLKTIKDLKTFFVRNNGTVNRIFQLLHPTEWTLVFIHIQNATVSEKKKKLNITGRWLKKLFAPYKFAYSLLILRLKVNELPEIHIPEKGLGKIVAPTRLISVQLQIKEVICEVKITDYDVHDDHLYDCNKMLRSPTLRTYDILPKVLTCFPVS